MFNRYRSEVEGNEIKMSRINSAGLINLTIEQLWMECYKAVRRGDYQTWNRMLDSIWMILGGDVQPNSPNEVKYFDIEKRLYKTGTLNHTKVGFEKLNKRENINMALQYRILMEKALFLRRLQNSQGKGTAYVNEDADDFD